jgi:ABC-type multidrug transport system ATPase subunit
MILLGILWLGCLCWVRVQARSADPASLRWRPERLLQSDVSDLASYSSMSESCIAAWKGESYTTSKAVNILFFYEVVTPNEPLQVGFAVESAVMRFLVDTLILGDCNSPYNGTDTLPVLNSVLGAAVGGSTIVSDCTKLVGDLPVGMNCFRMMGSNSVFLDESSTANVQTIQTEATRLVYKGFADGSINLGTEQGAYGFLPLPQAYLQPNVAVTSAKKSRALDFLYSIGIVLLSISLIVLVAEIWYWYFGDRKVENQIEEEFSLIDDSVQLERLRVLLAPDSRNEQDITEDISISYANSEEPKKPDAVNPFSRREGRTLKWRNVSMTLQGKSDEPDQKILDNVWGEVPRGETTAIMGSSGAGKSSLLNVLAGRAMSRGRITVQAQVRLDSFVVDPKDINIRKSIAFVAQDDSLQTTATPREAIRFSAKLRLPCSTTEDELDSLTTQMLNELGLAECADTVVGGPLLKGISGGERKRTSVGVEIVVKPAMVFLDEPTSGLDSFSAFQCCQILKKVANSGASVLFTIHQPSSDIFASFDHLILLQKGRLLYNGPVAAVPEYFGARGYPCPINYNPADWVLVSLAFNSAIDAQVVDTNVCSSSIECFTNDVA